MNPEDASSLLCPPKRAHRIFWTTLAAHVLLAVFILVEWHWEDEPEDFEVNLVEDPSTGPVVAPETTRLPPSPEPEVNVNPPPAPPEPEVPDMPEPPLPVPPEPEIVDMPMPVPREPEVTMPKKPPRKKAPPEPKIVMPKPRPKKASPADRVLKNTAKIGQKTGSQTHQDIPVGSRDAAQRYGEKFSNTPNGGKQSDARYAAVLGVFLKTRWSEFTPARAQLGDAKPEVTVWLEISGDGRLLNARIEKPSGHPGMDQAVRRLLESLKTQPFPRTPDGSGWKNRVIFDTSG